MRRVSIVVIALAIVLVAATALVVSRETDPLRPSDRGEVVISFSAPDLCGFVGATAVGLALEARNIPRAWEGSTVHGRLAVKRVSENWVEAVFRAADGTEIALDGGRADRPQARTLGC